MSYVLAVDPKTYKKVDALALAAANIDQFLRLNDLPYPTKFYIEAQSKRGWSDYGWYNDKTCELYVNLKKTKVPTKTPGYQWSFTGHCSDLTAPGVLSHEIGHHVFNMMAKRWDRRSLTNEARKYVKTEAAVSGYEPDTNEMFAEACRLYILNPTLLRLGRPLRYSFIKSVLDIEPLHECDWRSILKHAHPKIISAAQSWIERKK